MKTRIYGKIGPAPGAEAAARGAVRVLSPSRFEVPNFLGTIRMKLTSCILFVALAVAGRAYGAAGPVTITSDDMFNLPGQYYLAYSNPFDPNALSPTPYPVGHVAGTAGTNQFWDFSTGPTNVVYRFDYVSPTNVDAAIIADFPRATIVEKKTDQASGDTSYLFFDQVKCLGRQVYGAYLENPLLSPSDVFTSPILDFPDQIKFGDEWTTVATWISTVSGTDPTGGDPTDPTGDGSFSLDVQQTQTSDLKVDAWGTVVLPDDGFGQALRVNELVTIDVSADDGSGNFQHVETDYARNFYWLMPGKGIVASLASTQSGSPPADTFTTATQFWRTFQTNKKAGTTNWVCGTSGPQDFRMKIRVNKTGVNQEGQVLVSWGADPNGGTKYELQYSNSGFANDGWHSLGSVTNQFFMFDTTGADTQRFYRVISAQ